MKTIGIKSEDLKSEDFTNLVNLLSVFSEATHRLAEMEANISSEMMNLVDEYKPDYAKMQRTLTEAERALEVIAVKNPTWFTESRGIKTPYGTVKFRQSKCVVVSNEELSIELVRREADGLGLDPKSLIRSKEELDKEALEALTDDQLKKFRIRRETKDNFSVIAAKVDMGKAVKEAAEPKNPVAA